MTNSFHINSSILRKIIIAIVALLGLLVIFLPGLLAKMPYDSSILRMNARPPKPVVPSISLDSFAMPTPAIAKDSPVTWIVQLNNSTNETKLIQQVTQLQKAGYPAYIKASIHDKITVYTVFIGPETNIERVHLWMNKLSQQNIKGIILAYVP